MITKARFHFTTDNAQAAIEEIKIAISNAGFSYVGDIKIIDNSDDDEENRAYRNAFGKELSKEAFDKIDSESEEAWFDDYDFELEAAVETPDDKDALECLLKINYFGEIG